MALNTNLEQYGLSFETPGSLEFLKMLTETNKVMAQAGENSQIAARKIALAESALEKLQKQTQAETEAAKQNVKLREEQAKATDKLAASEQRRNQGGGEGKKLIDAGDVRDIIGNLGQLTGTSQNLTGLFRDLTSAGGVVGAGLVVVTAAANELSEALARNNKRISENLTIFAGEANAIQFTNRAMQERNDLLSKSQDYLQLFQKTLAKDALDLETYSFDPLKRQAAAMRNVKIAQAELSDQRQQETTAIFVQGKTQAAQAEALRQDITQLVNQGKSIDDLIPKIYEYNKLTMTSDQLAKLTAQDLELQARIVQRVGLEQHGREVVGGAIEKVKQQEEERSQNAQELANRLANQLQAIQKQRNETLQKNELDHANRMNDIARNGVEQRAQLERNYSKQVAQLAQGYQDQLTQLSAGRTEQLAKIEEQTQKQRSDVLTNFAKRNEEIEQAYQERIRAIQQTFQDSLEDIVARRDARALVNAQRQRNRGLQEADQSREKDKKKAQEDYSQAQQNLNKALTDERTTINRDYEKRLQELQRNNQRQQQQLEQAHREQLNDLNRSLQQQRDAENKSYAQQQQAAETAYAQRRNQLIAALAQEKNLTTEYAQSIITSLKGVLNPTEIQNAVKTFQDALQAKIDIKLTPLNTTTAPVSPQVLSTPIPDIGFTPYQKGGYVPTTRKALLHGDEAVLPLSNSARTRELLMKHVLPRIGRNVQDITPRGSLNLGSGSLNLSVNGRIAFDGEGVTAQMQEAANQQIIHVIKESLKGIKLGVKT